MTLSRQQHAFVQHYLVDFNATQAYIRAGYSAKGASNGGYRLLRHKEVQSEIEKAQRRLVARSTVSREWLVNELAEEFRDAREPTVRKSTTGEVISVTRKPQAVARIGELLARLHGWVDDKPNQPIQQLVNFVIQR